MELVQSYHQLNSFISEIRSLRKGFISNLFLHFEKHNLWIEKKELFYQATTEGYFIFRNNFKCQTFEPIILMTIGEDYEKIYYCFTS